MFVHFRPSPKPFVLLIRTNGSSLDEHVTSNMKQRQIRKSWRKGVTLKLLKVFLPTVIEQPVVLWCHDYLIDALSQIIQSVVLWAHCSCKSRAAWPQVEWDILHCTGIGAVCSHSEIRPTWHPVPLYARWKDLVTEFHSFIHASFWMYNNSYCYYHD